jgi:hypothetical protein
LIGAASIILFELRKEPEIEALPSYSPTLGWRTARPSEVGLNSEVLADMVSDIRASSTQTRSSLVVKDGYLIIE